MASLNRTRKEYHPAPYPRDDPVNGYDTTTVYLRLTNRDRRVIADRIDW